MTEVTFTKATGGHSVGDTLNTSPGAAAYLIESGIAEPAKAPDKQSEDVPQEPKARRVRGVSPASGPPTAG
jgi:hypothetical protein